jgi:hypothetical protein
MSGAGCYVHSHHTVIAKVIFAYLCLICLKCWFLSVFIWQYVWLPAIQDSDRQKSFNQMREKSAS